MFPSLCFNKMEVEKDFGKNRGATHFDQEWGGVDKYHLSLGAYIYLKDWKMGGGHASHQKNA